MKLKKKKRGGGANDCRIAEFYIHLWMHSIFHVPKMTRVIAFSMSTVKKNMYYINNNKKKKSDVHFIFPPLEFNNPDGAYTYHRPSQLLYHRRVQANVRQTAEYVNKSAYGFATSSASIVRAERQWQSPSERIITDYGHIRQQRRGR